VGNRSRDVSRRRRPCRFPRIWAEVPELELVHGVGAASSEECLITGEVLLVIVAHVRAGHVLVLHRGDALTNLLALDACNVGKHAFLAEVALGQVVGRQRSGVVGRQGDEVVEHACIASCPPQSTNRTPAGGS